MSYKTRSFVAAALLSWSFQARALIGANSEPPANLHREFPEIVRLQAGNEVCTGTIIGPRVVVSAAHCAELKNTYFVYQGERYNVTFTSSREYKSKEHDVAVAVTSRDIKNASFGTVGTGVRHGSTLLLAGFGCTVAGGKSGLLHIGSTKVIGMDADHMLSISSRGAVLCQGDSGGPAFLREGSKHVLVGVNSAGDIRNINLDVRLDSELSRGFLKRVADKFKVAICGITARCRAAPSQVAQLED
jgi:secreted trypsin-like serine protease